jgi:predicted ester cyclase
MSSGKTLVERLFSEVINGGRLLVRGSGTHTGDGLGFPATGKRFETTAANVGRIRDGRAIEHWSEQGMFPMLVQLGVIPAPTQSA